MNEPDELQLTLFQGGSRASHIALQESVMRLLMNVIYPMNLLESFAKLNQNGCWEKTYQGYLQVKMDDSLVDWLERWPAWGIVSGGQAYAPPGLEPYIGEKEYLLLPTLTASAKSATAKDRYVGSKAYRAARPQEALRTGFNDLTIINPNYCEIIMGFPLGWTELNQ